DGVPVGASLRSVCVAVGTHLTCPSISNRHHVLRVVHSAPVSRLWAWARGPIHRVMVSPCLSAGGLRFWGRPAPAGELGGPRDPLTGPVRRARPQRGYHVPHRVAAKGEGAWSTPGPGCPTGRRLRSPRP